MLRRKANPTPPKSITHQRHNTSVTSHQTKPETYGGSESRTSKTANRDLFNEDKSSPTKKMYTPQKEIKDKDIQPLKQKRKDSHDSTTPRHNDANRNSIRTPKLDANTNPPCATDTRDTDKVKSRFSLRSHSYSKDSGKINSVPKHIFDTNVSTKLSDLEDSKSHPFTSVSTATASKSTDKQARIYPNQTYILDRFTTNTSQLTIDKSPQSSINPALNTLPAGSQTGISADPPVERSISFITNNKSSTIVLNAQKPNRGLKNLGNTCFMNCILQCLSHTLPLKQFFVSDDYKKCLAGRKGNLSYAFKCVMTELWISSKDSYPPYDLKKQVGIVAPRFSGYSQQDAQEFMRFLLNEIHDEINKAELKKRQVPKENESLKEACDRYLTWENSKISDLFSGMLRSEVCCSACKSKSIVYDPFMDLALPIPKIKNVSQSFTSYSISYDNTTTDCAVKLNDCLQLFTHEETLDDEERPYCNKCKTMTKSTKQLGIERLPSFLVIQLKRFSGYSIRSKLSTPVEFEENWEIQDYNNNTHSYSLYGIACHSGGIYGGHYTAYCKYDKQWRYFNDHYTMLSSWEHVKRQEAYILFYEKNTQ